MANKVKELPPIRITISEWDQLEKHLRDLFRREIYRPLIKMLKTFDAKLQNAPKSELYLAIQRGKLQYYRGKFTGNVTAGISREIKGLGGQWNRSEQCWELPASKAPFELKMAMSASITSFEKKLDELDRHLSTVLPEQIAEKVQASKFFDKALWKMDREFKKNVASITVAPNLSDKERQEIADEWETNLKLDVKTWADEEVLSLRQKMKENVFAGNRYEGMIKTIQDSYGASEKKAKFLARQETHLALAKFKSARYVEAGVLWYKWQCVNGSPNHPVRESHKALNGRAFSFVRPPVTTGPGEPERRNNPSEDFGCRCTAIPLVGFKGNWGDPVK